MNLSEPGHLPYPPVEPYASGELDVDELHRIYWETSGSPDGVPVLFLHGGPGGGTLPVHRCFFDPAHYRIILFDQRGAGRSQPKGEIRANTTAHLISDMERLRELLGIEQWLLFGGSWGSTLALAYGETHPERCLGFILRGIFLGEAREIRWFLHDMQVVQPEAWRRFSGFLPEGEQGELLAAYRARLDNDDPAIHLPAARAWARYEASTATLLPNPALVKGMEEEALALARIEAHYMAHGMFLEEGQLLQGLDRIRHLPAIVVQGRYDMVCPIIAADALTRAWPEAYYEIVGDAGHSAFEPGIRRALASATEAFKQLLSQSKQEKPPAQPAKKKSSRRGSTRAKTAANPNVSEIPPPATPPARTTPSPSNAQSDKKRDSSRKSSRRRRKGATANSAASEN